MGRRYTGPVYDHDLDAIRYAPFRTHEIVFEYEGIPFVSLGTRGNAVALALGLTKQRVFMPKKYFNPNLTLKEAVTIRDIEWFILKKDTQRKVQLAHKELEEAYGGTHNLPDNINW